MAEWISNIILTISGGNTIIATMLISCFPLVELKGAIPIGQVYGLELWQSALLSFLGSTLVAVPLLLLLKPIFKWLGKFKFIRKIENVFKEKAEKATQNSKDKENFENRLFWIVLIFVSVPLPLTGVYTGSVIAAFMGMNFWKAFGAIATGNLIAGSIITLLTFLIGEQNLTAVLNWFFVIIAIVLVYYIIKVIVTKDKKEHIKEKEEIEK